MKNIIIESVSNGWIVTERFPCRNVASEPLAVYNDLEDLQAALPELLGNPHRPTPEPREFVNVGPAAPNLDSDTPF